MDTEYDQNPSTEEFNKKKIKAKYDDLQNLITGRHIPLTDLTHSSAGEYSETKTREFISELMDHIREYRLKEDKGMEIDRIIRIGEMEKRYGNKPVDTEKEINALKNEYFRETKDKYMSEDIFFENFLYCAIRIALSDSPQSTPCLGSIIEAAFSLREAYNNISLLDHEACRHEELDFKMMIKDCRDEGRDVSQAVRQYCLSDDDIFSMVNRLYFVLSPGSLPINTDIEKYKKNAPKHYRALKDRISCLEDEEKERQHYNEVYPPVKDPYGLTWEDMAKEDEFWFEEIKATPLPRPELAEFKKTFKQAGKFLKACELFRFYLNLRKTDSFRKHHSGSYEFVTQYGYKDFEKKLEYAIDRYISEHNMSIFTDTETCVYIYTLLSQAEDLAKKRIGGA